MWHKVLFQIIMTAMSAASPEIVEGIREAIDRMVARAAKTENPFDDVVTRLLQSIVGRPKEPVSSGD